jgi:ankyrin repeat protein
MYAAWNGHTKAVQTLLNNGARIDAKNRDGGTALSHALRNGHHDIVRILRTGQARPSGTSRSGKSASSLPQSKDLLLLSSSGKRNEGLKAKNMR